ncbi:MAG: hypothetical protein RIQ47_1687, partial [Bacteroidota bacterium]
MNVLREKFMENGFLVVENFKSPDECDALMQRAKELAEDFNYQGNASIFQTSEQTKTSDDYFLASGERISFFFEKDAFNSEGKLKT